MPKDTFLRLPKAKKLRIKNGAIETFNRLNYDEVTISDIVKDCDIPRGSFYQYFEDKFDVFKYLLAVVQEDKIKYMSFWIDKVGKIPFIELYPEMFKAGLKFGRDFPKLYRLGYHLYAAQDKKVKEINDVLSKMGIDMMESYIIKDQYSGYTKADVNPRIVATILYLINSRDILSMFYEGKTDSEIMMYIEEVLKIIQYGIESETHNGKSV